MISGTTAVSACISPSTTKSGQLDVDQLHGFLHLFGERMRSAAKVREGEQGHARLETQLAGKFRRQAGDLRQVFGGRVDVDRGIGKQVRALRR